MELLNLMMSMGYDGHRRFLPSAAISHRFLVQNKKKEKKKKIRQLD
jgi:hypothetical protein